MQIVGCIWKTGYNTLLQISVNEHTISAEMFSGSYKKSNFVNLWYEVHFDKIFAAVTNIIERIIVIWWRGRTK